MPRIIGKSLKIIMIAMLIAIVGILAFAHFSDDYGAYIVRSDSMQPTMNRGDMVFTGRPNRPLVGDIAIGEIITFERKNGLVTHRVQSIDGDTIYTKGDALEDTDPWTVSRFFDVKGCYMFHIPYLGLVSSFIKTKAGWAVCVILPAVLLLGFIIKDIVKESLKTA